MGSAERDIHARHLAAGQETNPPSGGARDDLRKLLEGSASDLKAHLAAILMTDERLRIRFVNREGASKNALKLLDELEANLDYWLKAAGVVVKNDAAASGDHRSPLTIACKLMVAPVSLGENGTDGVVVVVNPPSVPDFTNREKKVLKSLAATVSDVVERHYDAATGLMTRKEFEVVLDSASSTRTSSATRHCLLHLDLDELQLLEDTLGRKARDEVIRQVALQLSRNSDESRYVARVGAEEFAILVMNCPLERGFCVGQDIRRAISGLNIVWNDQPIKVTASVGVTQLMPGVGTPDSALAAARIACITAKELGKDHVKAFHHDDATRLGSKRRAAIVARIQNALQNGRFLLYGQPIKPLSKRNRGEHIEILLKGIDDDGEPLQPGEFIPCAEQSKIMPEIDRWVVRHSLEQLADSRVLQKRPETIFSINLSGQSLCDDGFLDFVIAQLQRTEVPPAAICFEITETAAILNVERATQLMSALIRVGCLFSLDDFGAGLSSFSYLRSLPVSFLKIDGQFIKEIVNDPVCSSIVAAISQMSHAMGLQTIAEFVESRAIKKHVDGLGIDYAQGNAIAKNRLLCDVLASLSTPKRSLKKRT